MTEPTTPSTDGMTCEYCGAGLVAVAEQDGGGTTFRGVCPNANLGLVAHVKGYFVWGEWGGAAARLSSPHTTNRFLGGGSY
jgi:hypothetical protein